MPTLDFSTYPNGLPAGFTSGFGAGDIWINSGVMRVHLSGTPSDAYFAKGLYNTADDNNIHAFEVEMSFGGTSDVCALRVCCTVDETSFNGVELRGNGTWQYIIESGGGAGGSWTPPTMGTHFNAKVEMTSSTDYVFTFDGQTFTGTGLVRSGTYSFVLMTGTTKIYKWSFPSGISGGGGGVTGTAALTQAAQTMAAAGAQTHTGTIAATQAAQTMSAAGVVGSVSGTIAATQDAQTLSAAGTTTVTGTIAATQDAQTLTAAGYPTTTGTAALAQDAQSMAAAGSQTHTGTSGWTQDAQTMAANGTIGSAVGGTMAATQADQTLTATGTVTTATNKLRLGTVTIFDFKVGTTQATKAYMGTTLVWQP